MAWVDKQHIPALEGDHRYTRLINLSKRLLEERVPACGNCIGGTITMQDADGNQTTVTCGECQGSGEVGTLQDNEDNGEAGGR